MWRSYALTLPLFFLLCQTSMRAQVVVPAGTILHCTLDEPNFSSATAEVGDPVLCNLSSLQQFGRTVFPQVATCRVTSKQLRSPAILSARDICRFNLTGSASPVQIYRSPAKSSWRTDIESTVKATSWAAAMPSVMCLSG